MISDIRQVYARILEAVKGNSALKSVKSNGRRINVLYFGVRLVAIQHILNPKYVSLYKNEAFPRTLHQTGSS